MTATLPLVKTGVKLVAGAAVSKVASDVIMSTAVNKSKLDKAKTIVGALVLGSMLSDIAGKHSEAKVDEILRYFTKVKKAKTA